MSTAPSSISLFSLSITDNMLDYCMQFIAWTDQYESLTVIDKRTLCTFAHGTHSTWSIGKTFNLFFTNRKIIPATVIKVNHDMDVIWLQTEQDICETKPETNLPGEKTSYFMFGHGGRQLEGNPRLVSEGIICSAKITSHGHILGTSGSSGGDSGSPVFRKSTGELIGMIVGGENVVVRRLENDNLVVANPSRAFIVPINSLLIPAAIYE